MRIDNVQERIKERRFQLIKFPLGERGQGMAEYAFILSLVVIVVIVILYFFGITLRDIYEYFVLTLVDLFSPE